MVKSAAAPVTNPIVGAAPVAIPATSVSGAASTAALPAEVKRAVDKYAAAMNKRVDMSPESRARAIQKYTERMMVQMPAMMS